MQRFLYIVNPISGKGRGKKLIPLIENFLNKNNINYKLKISEYHLHTTEIVKQNIEKFSTVICVGGDGTLNEIINGIPEDTFDHVNLGVLPIGTGNDFVKNIKLHNDLLKNLSIFSGLVSNKIRITDIGMIDYRTSKSDKRHFHLFINAAGLGFDAHVGALTKNNKILSGKLAYLISVIKAMVKFEMINGNYSFNGSKITGSKLMLSIGNGISHGGGFYLTPNAKIDDEMLDISIFDAITRRRLLTALPKALINKIETIDEAKLYKTNEIHIQLSKPCFIHCDGEIISEDLFEVYVSLYDKKLKIVEEN